MLRYQILIEYVGTKFIGWQVQKKGKTVQGLIQEKISKLLREKIILYGAGRLDVGVHAKEQSAHFDSKNKIFHTDKFIKSMIKISELSKSNPKEIINAPIFLPVERLDEAKAARNPVLAWEKK